jgi:SSS family solute:Na+ symporter
MVGMANLATFDILVIAVFLIVVLVVGFWFGRGDRNAGDYFLAGRALPWYLIGFSFYASNMSGASFVGLIGASYSHGVVVFNYEWTATAVLILFALFMLPVFLREKLYTVPEYLERRFDRRSRWLYSAFSLATLLFIDMAGALYAGSVVVAVAFPGVDLWTITALLAFLAGGYAIVGGLRAVVVTDALQSVLMIVGAGAIVVIGLPKVGGLTELLTDVGPTRAQLFRPADDGFLPWPGIAGVMLLGFYYWTLNQYFVQRALAARSLDEGRKGALFGGLLKLPNFFLMIVPGLIALRLFPELESPDQAFPRLVFELLPVGLKGLVLTALIAAVMSSLDSAFNAASSLITMDFVRPIRPDLGDRWLLRIGRLVTAMMMVLAAGYAPLIESFGSLFQYFQSTLAYLVPPVVAVYFGGLFVVHATARGAFVGLGVGLAVGLILFLAVEVTGVWASAGFVTIHFTYIALIMFAFTAVLMALVSLIDRPVAGTARWQPSDLSHRGPIWSDVRLLSALLAGALVLVLWLLV